MNTNGFVPYAKQDVTDAIGPHSTAPEIIDNLCERAIGRMDPELIARIHEVKGLYSGYDTVSNPELADNVIIRLGLIIDYLLGNRVDPDVSPYEADDSPFKDVGAFLTRFHDAHQAAEKNPLIKEWIDAYVQYLKLQGRKEQTVKIYRGKVSASLPCKEEPISRHNLRDILNHTLDRAMSVADRDHNLISAVRQFLRFLAELP